MKDAYIEAHEELISEMMERTGCSWEQAYDACGDGAYERYVDKMLDQADTLRQREKDERL